MLTVIPQESARRELNRAEELSAQQRSYVSFLDSPLRQTPWQFSTNEHDITRASSQPLTAHPSTWVLSPEEPCSPAGWARTATSYSAGGSRHSISPKAVPVEIMQRRGRRHSTSGPALGFLARASWRRFREATLARGSDTAPSATSD